MRIKGGKQEGLSRNTYEIHTDKANVGRIVGRRQEWVGRGEWRAKSGDNNKILN